MSRTGKAPCVVALDGNDLSRGIATINEDGWSVEVELRESISLGRDLPVTLLDGGTAFDGLGHVSAVRATLCDVTPELFGLAHFEMSRHVVMIVGTSPLEVSTTRRDASDGVCEACERFGAGGDLSWLLAGSAVGRSEWLV